MHLVSESSRVFSLQLLNSGVSLIIAVKGRSFAYFEVGSSD